MIRIAVVIGSLLASTAAYAANLMQAVDTQDQQTGYMPFPWDNEDDGCES